MSEGRSPRPGTPSDTYNTYSTHRTRPRLTDQIQVIRELWLLREQARVQAAERCFLTELERLLSGRSYPNLGEQPLPSPPPPPQYSHHAHADVAVVSQSVPQPPPPPPLPPTSPASSFSAVSHLADGRVFESHPPPRGDHAPARETPDTVSREMEQARASHRVTNLSAEFRARLEGVDTGGDVSAALSRSRSFGQLSGQRNVTSVLDSQFRHHLENLLHRRGPPGQHPHTRQPFRMGAFPQNRAPSGDVEQLAQMEMDGSTFGRSSESAALEGIVTALREEVTMLKNVVNASFDLQLDIQRSIRQEVAAAMSAPATLSWGRDGIEETSMCTTEGSSGNTSMVPSGQTREPRVGVVKAGFCTVCLENSVDSLLYGCGHMCTCAACGRQLLASGQSCPICRAPVRDVVRAYVVTE